MLQTHLTLHKPRTFKGQISQAKNGRKKQNEKHLSEKEIAKKSVCLCLGFMWGQKHSEETDSPENL